LENNTGFGVAIPAFFEHRWTQENSIHHNTFANNNNEGKKEALDDGVNNVWDNGINAGNYWSDWWGIGSYKINGLAKSKDYFPLRHPLHELTTEVPRILKGRVIEFSIIIPILLITYMLIEARRVRRKSEKEEKK
jgi:hypothetical protein